MKRVDNKSVMDGVRARFLGRRLGGWLRHLFNEGPLKKYRAPARRGFYRYIHPLPYQIYRIRSHGLRYRSGERLAFVPDMPLSSTVMHKICEISGHQIQNHIDESVTLVMYWQDTTFGDDISPLTKHFLTVPVANQGCRDITKQRLDIFHHTIFGYGVNIDPRSYDRVGVGKSNANARGDGEFIQFPTRDVDPDRVYQRLIDNSYGHGLVQDIRVPIFRDRIPFVYMQYHCIADRFKGTNSRATIEETERIFSSEEEALIVALCKRMGLDYGELDVLRDRADQRIYVVDLNNTPVGPVSGLTKEDHWEALKRMAITFQDVFLSTRLSAQEGDHG